MNSDPLTIAYVAHGAFKALDQAGPRDHSRAIDRFEGELGFIDAVLAYLPQLEGASTEPKDWLGVFPYDVAEPFGFEVGKRLIADGYCRCPDEIALDLVKEATQ